MDKKSTVCVRACVRDYSHSERDCVHAMRDCVRFVSVHAYVRLSVRACLSYACVHAGITCVHEVGCV